MVARFVLQNRARGLLQHDPPPGGQIAAKRLFGRGVKSRHSDRSESLEVLVLLGKLLDQDGQELQMIDRELLKLAQEQGNLTCLPR